LRFAPGRDHVALVNPETEGTGECQPRDKGRQYQRR
jgi:hypothetical protein